MKANDYLKKILKQQTFDRDAGELKDLRKRRDDIRERLRSHFSKSDPSVTWAGSMAKGTMIRESYDGDMTCYFPEGEAEAGKTLQEIYDNVKKALVEDYKVQRKASALRVRDKDDWNTDLHIDVVPGRYTDEDAQDVFLHRTTPEKERLKTNLQTHVDHIKDSGVIDAIRLIKLWKAKNGIEAAKTFVLELLVVKLLKNKKSSGLSTQLEHFWTELRDNADGLAVEDPANSNNDLKSILDECRTLLSSTATDTLRQIESDNWKAVFGEVDDDDDGKDDGSRDKRARRSASLKAAAASVSVRTKPWYRGE